MRFFSVLPSIEIPINHLYKIFENETQQGYFLNTLNKLVASGWIEKYSNDYYRIHPLVQLTTQQKLNPTPEECKVIIDNLHNIFDLSVDYIDLQIYIPYCESIIKYFDGKVYVKIALLLNKLSYVYTALAQYEKAFKVIDSALKIFSVLKPRYFEAEAQTYGGMMKLLGHIGRYGEAIQYGERCIEIQESVLHHLHHDLAATYIDISKLYRIDNRIDLAIHYITKGTDIQKWLYHNHYSDRIAFNLINAYNSFAAVLGDFGRNGDKQASIRALFMGYRALVTARRFLSERHHIFAIIYNDVSLTLRDLGCYEKAMQYLTDATNLSENVLPTDHPNIAINYYNFGILYMMMDEKEKAIEFASKALYIQEKIFSPEHSSVIATTELLEKLRLS